MSHFGHVIRLISRKNLPLNFLLSNKNLRKLNTKSFHRRADNIQRVFKHSLCLRTRTSELVYFPTVSAHRFQSTDAVPQSSDADPAATTDAITEGSYIPDRPPIPLQESDVVTDSVATEVFNQLGERTLSSLGLCNYTPPGLYQWCLEHLHVTAGLPWWLSIAASTLVIRLFLFPLVIKTQKSTVSMANHMPTVQRLQSRLSEHRAEGNMVEMSATANELMDYLKRNNVKPFRSMMMPLFQAPIFVSVFLGIRGMTNIPVESLLTGGVFWITDLTIPDPTYILPVLTAGTLLATVEIGADGMKANTMGQTGKIVLRIMPFCVFPFIMNFPTALCMYWFTSNVFSLMQVSLLRIPKVRKYFGIPEVVKHIGTDGKKKGFLEGMRENMDNSKMLSKIENRSRHDAVKFKEAGMGPIVKTYKTDPTKPPPAVAAKSNSSNL